ncbi:Protein virilizer [Hirschfeldia incana]|nr:Protein virilizer [Hirschfeldia incana]
MRGSKFKMLWEGIKPLQCLKMFDLSYSRNLKMIPDLSNATSLEELFLHDCRSLLEITNSIYATKLYRLDISKCTKIEDFPNVPDSIEKLVLCETGIKEVPGRVENLSRLRKLFMHGCEKLKTISPNIYKLENLEFLGLSKNGECVDSDHSYHGENEDTDEIDTFLTEKRKKKERDTYGGELFEAIIKWGPDFERTWRLRSDLDVHYILPLCLPEKALTSPISLRFRGNGIKTIPGYIKRLSKLIALDVQECSKLLVLPQLRHSLVYIEAQGCESLWRIDSSFQNPNICLNFIHCHCLNRKARKLIQTSACQDAVLPGEEMPKHFTHQASSGRLTIKSTPRPLPSSFRFKACILLNVYDRRRDNNDDEEGENSLTGLSYSVKWKQNGFTVGRKGSHQMPMPNLYISGRHNLFMELTEEYGAHLFIFEESFVLSADDKICSPEAEETTFDELTFVFRVDKTFKVKGYGVRILEANDESADGEDDDSDDSDSDSDDYGSDSDYDYDYDYDDADGEDDCGDDEDDSGDGGEEEEEEEEEEDDDDDDDEGGEDHGDDDDGGDGDNNKVVENNDVILHSSDSLSNQSSPLSRGTLSPSGGGPMPLHPSAISQPSSNPYASLPPRTSTLQTFGYNQGGACTTEVQQQSGSAIDPQSGTVMISYPPPTSMQFGYSWPFYGNPMHLGGDMPPHPSATPQYSSNPYASLPPRTSTVQTFGYNQGGGAGTTEVHQQSGPSVDPQSGTGMTSYPPPMLMQSGYSRPFYGNPMHQGGDKQQQNMLPVPQSINPHSIPQQLPSMQLQRPMQPPQHVRPFMQMSQPTDQGVSLQNQYQIPLHPMQMMQQTQVQPYYLPPQQQEISYQIPLHLMQLMQQTQVQPYYLPPQQQEASYQIPLHSMHMMQQTQVQPYYHPPQQQEISHVQQQQQAVQGQQGAGSSQRQESGMSSHDYLQTPETIQALLSNREKLCELLEQDPKIMQMLQEKMGQL